MISSSAARRVVVIAAACVAASGGLLASHGGTPASQQTVGGGGGAALANLWVNPTPGASPARCASPCAYSAANAYGSLSAAYTAAQAGDTVDVRYTGANGFAGDSIGPGSKTVTIQADPNGGGTPEFGRFVNAAANSTIKNLRFEARGTFTDPGCTNLQSGGSIVNACEANETFDGVTVDGSDMPTSAGACPDIGVYNDGGHANPFTFKNGKVQNIQDAKGMELGGQNLTIADNTFTNISVENTCNVDVHNECIFASTDLTGSLFDGNVFLECPTQALFLTACTANDPSCTVGIGHDITIQNNVFSHTVPIDRNQWHPSCALVLGSQYTTAYQNYHLRNNDFESCWTGSQNASSQNLNFSGTSDVTGNLGGNDCLTGATYSHNVGDACGVTDIQTTPGHSDGPPNTPATAAVGWVDPANGNFHIIDGTQAGCGHGDQTVFPATDADGTLRLAPIDAGAYVCP